MSPLMYVFAFPFMLYAGAIVTFPFVSWCMQIANKEYDKEGEFGPKLFASIIILSIFFGGLYAEISLIDEGDIVLFIFALIGNVIGVAFPFVQSYNNKKWEKEHTKELADEANELQTKIEELIEKYINETDPTRKYLLKQELEPLLQKFKNIPDKKEK